MATKPKAPTQQAVTVTELPVHIPTSSEAGAYLVERITNEGSIVVRDPDTGAKSTCRLAVLVAGGQPHPDRSRRPVGVVTLW